MYFIYYCQKSYIGEYRIFKEQQAAGDREGSGR
jgi:hypothetical protein